jgi:antitoxin component YwqK of YwqJK toxin-antitoxin module
MVWKKYQGRKIFEGQFKDGVKCGPGKAFFDKLLPEVQHIGAWKDDLREGLGCSYQENGKLECRGRYTGDSLDRDRFYLKYLKNGKIDIKDLREREITKSMDNYI